MTDNIFLNTIIFIALSGIVGFFLLYYLRGIITDVNTKLIQSIEKVLLKNSKESVKYFNEFLVKLDNNFENHIIVINKFSDHLKKETDKYSESISKFRNSINQINDKSMELIELNKTFLKELRDVSFKDLKMATETLLNSQKSLSKIESAFFRYSDSVQDLLYGLKDLQISLQNSDKNVQTITTLNKNLDIIITSFKETIIQIQLVSNSVSMLSEGKMKVLIDEVTNILPEIRKESTKYSTSIYGKFSDTLDKLNKIAINLKDLTLKYNSLIDGNKKDLVTKDFLD